MKQAVTLLVVLAASLVIAAPVSGQYQITESVVASGGTSASGGSYSVAGTVGQPAIGVTDGGSYINEVGFWYQPGWILTGVEDDLLPTRFELGQNFPNPFNPVTTFRFAVPAASHVTIALYDVAGREVRTLVNDDYTPGFYDVPLRADGLASGVYFCRMSSGGFSETRKLLLLK